ncbi:hypothetical protein BC830DRAFT_1171939 [Chytriomyces sp. MP71]|nr:hypothetical protein BC830DRAFT_1171939 [Chytriomyces sp. MP71]
MEPNLSRGPLRSNSYKSEAISVGHFSNTGAGTVVTIASTGQQLFVHDSSTILLSHDGGLWQAAENGDLESLKLHAMQPLILEDGHSLGPRALAERGGDGETILHEACLMGHKQCIRWLVTQFPELVNQVALKDRFKGQTPLHLAVVKSEIGDLEMVQFLVEMGARVNVHPPTGREFRNIYYDARRSGNGFKKLQGSPEEKQSRRNYGKFYYGGSILQFAVSSGKNQIVRYLVENKYDPADLIFVDQYGNNVLHVLAYHGASSLDLWNYIRDRNRVDLKLGRTEIDLSKARNCDNLTPLQVGVSRGHTIALDTLKTSAWRFGAETNYRVLIDELDPLLAQARDPSCTYTCALSLAVLNQDKSIITHPFMDVLLKWKWVLYARKKFLARFLASALVLLFYMICVALQPVSFTARRRYEWSLSGDTARSVFEAATVTGIGIIFLWEMQGFRVQERQEKIWSIVDQVRNYLSRNGAFGTVAGMCVVTVAVVRFGISRTLNIDASGPALLRTENVLLGLAAISGWIHMLGFAKGFASVGLLVVVFRRILARDLIQWLWLYAALTSGFAAALYLQMAGVDGVPDWNTLPGSILWTFRYLFSQAVFDDLRKSEFPVFAEALFVVYGILVLVLFYNILIAKLVDTFEDVSQDSKRVWKLEFARLVLGIDDMLTEREREETLDYMGWQDKWDEGPRYFLFTERYADRGAHTSSEAQKDGHKADRKNESRNSQPSRKDPVKVVVARRKDGRSISFIPYNHTSYWDRWWKDEIHEQLLVSDDTMDWVNDFPTSYAGNVKN